MEKGDWFICGGELYRFEEMSSSGLTFWGSPEYRHQIRDWVMFGVGGGHPVIAHGVIPSSIYVCRPYEPTCSMCGKAGFTQNCECAIPH